MPDGQQSGDMYFYFTDEISGDGTLEFSNLPFLVEFSGAKLAPLRSIGETISIGRQPTCLLRSPPDMTSVSRTHATLKLIGDDKNNVLFVFFKICFNNSCSDFHRLC
jgi:hypothetical protein